MKRRREEESSSSRPKTRSPPRGASSSSTSSSSEASMGATKAAAAGGGGGGGAMSTASSIERALQKQYTGPPTGKLFVGNLDWKVTEEMILKIFRPWGNVTNSTFFYHNAGPNQGKPRGFCFVEYATAEDAARAINELDGRTLFKRTIKVRFSKPEGSGPEYNYHNSASSSDGGVGGGSAVDGAGRGALASEATAIKDERVGDMYDLKLSRKMALLKQKLKEGAAAASTSTTKET